MHSYKPRNIKKQTRYYIFIYFQPILTFYVLYYYCHDSISTAASRHIILLFAPKIANYFFVVLKRKHKDYLFGNKDILRYITFYNGMGTTKITFVQTNLSIPPSK